MSKRWEWFSWEERKNQASFNLPVKELQNQKRGEAQQSEETKL